MYVLGAHYEMNFRKMYYNRYLVHEMKILTSHLCVRQPIPNATHDPVATTIHYLFHLPSPILHPRPQIRLPLFLLTFKELATMQCLQSSLNPQDIQPTFTTKQCYSSYSGQVFAMAPDTRKFFTNMHEDSHVRETQEWRCTPVSLKSPWGPRPVVAGIRTS